MSAAEGGRKEGGVMATTTFPTGDGNANISLAFEGIKAAAVILSAFPYAEAAASLRRQDDWAWIGNPTLAQQMDRKDLERKMRLLDAAAAFVGAWESVQGEVLGAAAGDPPEGAG